MHKHLYPSLQEQAFMHIEVIRYILHTKEEEQTMHYSFVDVVAWKKHNSRGR
jgi:hypothetical protein